MKVLKCLSSHRYIGPGCFMGGLQEQFQADSPIEASVPHRQQGDGENVESENGD